MKTRFSLAGVWLLADGSPCFAGFAAVADATGAVSGTFAAADDAGAVFSGLTVVADLPDYVPPAFVLVLR